MKAVEALLTPALAAIHERRSVRAYTSDSVERYAIERLLDAAIWAPSARNAQPWAFVVVQDPVVLMRLETEAATLYFRDPPIAELAALAPDELQQLRDLVLTPGFGILHGAPALIVIYATSAAAIPDCYLAAENLLLAATALGLGTCPVGLARPLFDQPGTKAEFGVPTGYACALPVVLGVAAAGSTPPPRTPPSVLAWS
jgi:nitroreductase